MHSVPLPSGSDFWSVTWPTSTTRPDSRSNNTWRRTTSARLTAASSVPGVGPGVTLPTRETSDFAVWRAVWRRVGTTTISAGPASVHGKAADSSAVETKAAMGGTHGSAISAISWRLRKRSSSTTFLDVQAFGLVRSVERSLFIRRDVGTWSANAAMRSSASFASYHGSLDCTALVLVRSHKSRPLSPIPRGAMVPTVGGGVPLCDNSLITITNSNYRNGSVAVDKSKQRFDLHCTILKANFYVRIAKSKVNVTQDVYWAYFRCCSSYKDKIRFCVFKSMSSMMADISAEFTAKLHWFLYVLSFVLGYIIVLRICFSVCLGLVLFWLIVELKWSILTSVADPKFWNKPRRAEG